jgi:hypothetical protein
MTNAAHWPLGSRLPGHTQTVVGGTGFPTETESSSQIGFTQTTSMGAYAKLSQNLQEAKQNTVKRTPGPIGWLDSFDKK